MTMNHAWNTRNSIADITNDVKPALSEKINRAKIKVKATAGVAKATRDFAHFEDRKYPIPETISRSQSGKDECRIGLAAKTAHLQHRFHTLSNPPRLKVKVMQVKWHLRNHTVTK